MDKTKKIGYGILLVIMLLLGTLAGTVINKNRSYFEVENSNDLTISVTAAKAVKDASGTGRISIAEGQKLEIRSYLVEGDEVRVDVYAYGDPVASEQLSGIDYVSLALEPGDYDVKVTALSTVDGFMSVEVTPPVLNQDELADSLMLSWEKDAASRNMLVSYMKVITDPSSDEYIPVERRIAVFDLDGTLFCETDPNYFDYTLLVYRVTQDPDYIDKASDFEKEVAEKIITLNETGVAASGLEVDHGRAVASAFAGMTPDEFNAYIQEFKKLPMPSYNGMLRGEGWYKPMLELVEYLQANDFTVYVVSGTDRFIVRGIVYDSPLKVDNEHIIGSDESLVATNQEDVNGLDYVYTDEDDVILGGDFLIKNLKMNKVTAIVQEIGVQPVLSFGNSTGDASMAQYVVSNNQYDALAFMLCCDDLVRENGNEDKAAKMFTLCEGYGWVPISMKNDWTTIYGEGVTKK